MYGKCLICKKKYEQIKKHQNVCSTECRLKKKALKKREWRAKQPKKTTKCIICDNFFFIKGGQQKTCSLKCRKKWTYYKNLLYKEENKEYVKIQRQAYYNANKLQINEKSKIYHWKNRKWDIIRCKIRNKTGESIPTSIIKQVIK